MSKDTYAGFWYAVYHCEECDSSFRVYDFAGVTNLKLCDCSDYGDEDDE
ncbi:hypothetical protein ACN20G_23630 [Streptomyces sp. BI20]